MTEKQILEQICVELVKMSQAIADLTAKAIKLDVDLSEFSDRFEEVIDRLETERRIDLYGEAE